MVKAIQRFIFFEKTYLAKVPANSLRVMVTFMLYGLAMPVLEVFTSAFLWRQTNNLSSVAVYYITIFATMYLTFLANTFLLKIIPIQKLFATGTLLRGVALVILMSLSQPQTSTIVLLGIFTGVTSGLLWSNRNYINLRATSEENRDYFNSTVSVSDTLAGILVPLAAGWFITLAAATGLSDLNLAYLILALVVFTVLLVAAGLSLSIKIPNPNEKLKILLNVSRNWWLVRAITFSNGAFQGISFAILGAIILKYAGDEGTLGTIQSLTALIGAVVLYLVGKKISAKDRPRIIAFRAIAMIFGCLAFLFNLNFVGVAAFSICLAISQPFWVSAIFSLWQRSIEVESEATQIGANNYLLDIEFFINLGRGLLLVLFVIVSSQTDESNAVVVAFAAVIVTQVTLVLANYLLHRHPQI